MIWKYFKRIDNNMILNFLKPLNSQLLYNRLFGTLLAFFFYQILYNNRVQKDGKNS